MRVKRILSRLRKERNAIDEAIAALELVSAQPKSSKRNPSARSGKQGPVPREGNTTTQSETTAAAETKVIDFRRNERTG
jgi:hypothetical protein